MVSLNDLMISYFSGNGNGTSQGTATNPTIVRLGSVLGIDRSASVGLSSGILIAANTARTKFFIKNDSANSIWINLGATAVASAGGGNLKIATGGYFELDLYNGVVNAIAETGAVNITAREFV